MDTLLHSKLSGVHTQYVSRLSPRRFFSLVKAPSKYSSEVGVGSPSIKM